MLFRSMAMAQCARKVIATFEYFYDGDLLDDKHMAPSTISQLYTTATVHASKGAWPVAFGSEYPFDAAHMTLYAEMARTESGFADYLDQYVLQQGKAA